MMTIVEFLLQSAASATVVLLTLVGFAPTKLGEKFLNHFLERKLASQRHEYDTKIEELKANLAHLGDRGVRSNEREFNSLTLAWESFVDAWLSTQVCAMQLLQYPNLRRLNDETLQQFLASTELSSTQKKQVADSDDRNNAYAKAMEINQIATAQSDVFNTKAILRKQGVFIIDELKELFDKNIEVLSKAQIQRMMEYRQVSEQLKLSDVEFLLTNGQQMFDELQAATRARMLHV